ncbi:MAG: glycosyltransferase family 39 protein [Candidatus Omnitrophica bacterium]|nr:glycosyltransferase family 39 protein [Candidatus Omnitrophota bacterium]
MAVCIALPLLFLGFTAGVFILKGLSRREAFLAALAVLGALVVVFTESLSFFAALNFWTVLLLWSLACAAAGGLFLRNSSGAVVKTPALRLALSEAFMLALIGLLLGVTLFIGVYAPPNTWDAMTYHMPRVLHWAQNHGVMNYPTNISRQLVYLPYAEYAILQAQVLSGSDRFANLVQWMALLGSAVGVSLVVRELGGTRFGQIAAALGFCTLPGALLEATGTKNNLVAAYWTVSLAVFILIFIRSGKIRWILLSAVALGLGLLTKSTGLLFGVPFIILALSAGKVPSGRKFLLTVAVVVAVMVLTGPFALRLMQIKVNLVDAMKIGSAAVERFGPAETASNVVRGIGTELALPVNGWNSAILGAVSAIHQGLGIGMSDPKTTIVEDFRVAFLLDEDTVDNPLQMLFILAAACIFLIMFRQYPLLWGYTLAFAGGVLLFNATVKWQPSVTRFHLPFFALALPWAVAVCSGRFFEKAWLCVLSVCFLFVWYPLMINTTRPLLTAKSMFLQPRAQMYFMKHPWEYPVVDKMSKVLKDSECRAVGLYLVGGDDWEYSWQVFLGPQFRIEHVNLTDENTAHFAYPLGAFTPCAVVAIRTFENVAAFNSKPYVKVVQALNFGLYFDPVWVRARASRP